MPCLKNLEVGVSRFDSMNLADPINLSELRLHYDKHKFNLSTFCKVFANSPKLKFLGMYDISSEKCDDDDPKSVEIVCQLTIAALSQGKKVTIANSGPSSNRFDRKLKIKKKKYDELDFQIQTLFFELRCKYFTIFRKKLTPYLKGYIFEYS